jgi:acetolactate synthase-1/2/3 large subunit
MSEISGADAFVKMLQLQGVKHIFGLCGDTSLPFYDALQRLDHGIKHVLTRDERSAAYMADCYARVSGRVGVCEGPSGGGATYILPGLVEANESSIPILAVTTDISVSSRGRYTLTELDQENLFRPVTKWNKMLDRSAEIPRTLRTAFAQMTSGKPGSAQIGLPYDVQTGMVSVDEIWADPDLNRYPSRRVGPDPDAVLGVTKLLVDAERPVFICGGGVVISGAEPDLQSLAERIGACVATTISGQGSISEEHPLALGVVGSNGGTPQTRSVVQQADLVVFIGCRAGSVTTERWRYPTAGQAKVVHIDVDPAVIGTNYRTDGVLVGDARLALQALNEACESQGVTATERGAQRELIANAKLEKFAQFRQLAESTAAPIRPERVVADLQSVLPDDAVIVADPGTPCPYFSAYFVGKRSGRHFISNRAHGALGYSLSGAIGAHMGRPGTKTVAVMGDGSFGFTGGELETVVRHKLPITFIVISNSTYGWIKAGQKTAFEGRYFSVDFDRTNHAKVAEAYGLKVWRVEDPLKLRSAFAAAVAHDGPTLVDVLCQPLHEARAPVSEWVA